MLIGSYGIQVGTGRLSQEVTACHRDEPSSHPLLVFLLQLWLNPRPLEFGTAGEPQRGAVRETRISNNSLTGCW